MIVYTFLNYYDLIEIDVYKYKGLSHNIYLSHTLLIHVSHIRSTNIVYFFNSSNIQIQFRYVIYLNNLCNFNNVYIMPLA